MSGPLLFPTSIVGSMPRPQFVKDLIRDDADFSPEEYDRLMRSSVRESTAEAASAAARSW